MYSDKNIFIKLLIKNTITTYMKIQEIVNLKEYIGD